jgi:hypothetical protein
MDSSEFNPVYWASQPPEVRALEVNTTPDEDARSSRAVSLAIKGFKIDIPIMVWGWDPFKVMKMRMDFGYTWVPNALQPPLGIAPGLKAPGITPYDPNNPPGGAIKVSIDPADYPAYPMPTPVPSSGGGVEAFSGDPVGVQSVGVLYYSVPGETIPDGQKFTDTRGTFLKHITITPFGRSHYWEKIS